MQLLCCLWWIGISFVYNFMGCLMRRPIGITLSTSCHQGLILIMRMTKTHGSGCIRYSQSIQWEESDTLGYCRIIESCHKLICEDEFGTTLTWVLELSHFVNHLARNSIQMPWMMWQDTTGKMCSLDGRPISLVAFHNMYFSQRC